MAKIRVYELAKKLNMTNRALLTKLEAMNIEVKSHMSSLEDETVAKIKENLFGNKQKKSDTRVKASVIRRRKKNRKNRPAGDDVSSTESFDSSASLSVKNDITPPSASGKALDDQDKTLSSKSTEDNIASHENKLEDAANMPENRKGALPGSMNNELSGSEPPLKNSNTRIKGKIKTMLQKLLSLPLYLKHQRQRLILPLLLNLSSLPDSIMNPLLSLMP
ncbi:hypothetical protein MTBBW1_1610010 [Desulfamplus magnetovallimortis]|uniref:Translation initiation factor IF-2 N-terminal domain-containing protein n=1 Tax=Desulfamplus magnetovallimortis TaxID=1246637 RepID=A0A1W1H905_9BACT|nr:translation initiation factor IF-2 N-terminal domain-containing protein [Desulfamplus magnetovallimortis]SLM28848.1 hypothetical protein MTBBW1_1610010 [Desulfamplus magnetovallimortis]